MNSKEISTRETHITFVDGSTWSGLIEGTLGLSKLVDIGLVEEKRTVPSMMGILFIVGLKSQKRLLSAML